MPHPVRECLKKMQLDLKPRKMNIYKADWMYATIYYYQSIDNDVLNLDAVFQ